MHRVTRYGRKLAVALLAVLMLTGIAARAIAQSATGSIEGTVVDQAGAVLPGVTITVCRRAPGSAGRLRPTRRSVSAAAPAGR